MNRLLVVSLVACAMLGFNAGPHYTPWSVPENLGPAINSSFDDYGGALSKDGLSLYFTSTRPGGLGGEDLWVSWRNSTDETFGPPQNVSIANSSAADRIPALSRDGHWLLFASDRLGGSGKLDIWACYREQTHDDFGWTAPVNLGTGINDTSHDTGPAYLAADEGHRARIYFARGASNPAMDIWVSEQTAEGEWGAAVPVTELNTAFNDAGPDIRHDGLEIVFHSNRSGEFDLWAATRETTDEPFSSPANLGEPANSPGSVDRDAGLSAKGDVMVLSSDRPGGAGGLDLYICTREKNRR
jgi:Tol biopolymer transport system component